MIKEYYIKKYSDCKCSYYDVYSVNVVLFKFLNFKIVKSLKKNRDYLFEDNNLKIKEKYKKYEIEVIYVEFKRCKDKKNSGGVNAIK